MKPENPIGATCRDCGKAPATIIFYLDPETFVGTFCYDCFQAWLEEASRSKRITEDQLTEIVMSMAAHLSEEQQRLLLLALEALKGDSN